MDTCPNCGATLPEFMVKAMQDPNETWAVCPKRKLSFAKRSADGEFIEYEAFPPVKDLASVTRISDLPPAVHAAADWYYGRLWNAIFENDPKLQMKVPDKKPDELISWGDFSASMDQLFPVNKEPGGDSQQFSIVDQLNSTTPLFEEHAKHTDGNKENI